MTGRWSQQGEALQMWRQALARSLINIDCDSVTFSHHVAINTAVGVAQNSEQVHNFRLNYCSVSLFETDGQTLRLIDRGDEARTPVN